MDYEKALEIYDRMEEGTPKMMAAMFISSSMIVDMMGIFKEALEAFKEALEALDGECKN